MRPLASSVATTGVKAAVFTAVRTVPAAIAAAAAATAVPLVAVEATAETVAAVELSLLRFELT